MKNRVRNLGVQYSVATKRMRGAYLSLLNIQLVQRYDFLLDVQALTTTFLCDILRGIMEKRSLYTSTERPVMMNNARGISDSYVLEKQQVHRMRV